MHALMMGMVELVGPVWNQCGTSVEPVWNQCGTSVDFRAIALLVDYKNDYKIEV